MLLIVFLCAQFFLCAKFCGDFPSHISFPFPVFISLSLCPSSGVDFVEDENFNGVLFVVVGTEKRREEEVSGVVVVKERDFSLALTHKIPSPTALLLSSTLFTLLHKDENHTSLPLRLIHSFS